MKKRLQERESEEFCSEKVSVEHPHEYVGWVMDYMNLQFEEKKLTVSNWKLLTYW